MWQILLNPLQIEKNIRGEPAATVANTTSASDDTNTRDRNISAMSDTSGSTAIGNESAATMTNTTSISNNTTIGDRSVATLTNTAFSKSTPETADVAPADTSAKDPLVLPHE